MQAVLGLILAGDVQLFFFFNLEEKNSLRVKKFASVQKIATIVYQREKNLTPPLSADALHMVCTCIHIAQRILPKCKTFSFSLCRGGPH